MMRCRVALGRLEDVVQVRGHLHSWERMVAPRFAPGFALLDGHHGRPLADLVSAEERDGVTVGVFEVRKGREAEVAALAGRPLSIEFDHDTADSELEAGAALDGGSVLRLRGVLLRGVAALARDEEPARSDCRMLSVDPVPATAKREPALATRAAYPQAIRDRLDGRTVFGAANGRVLGVRR